jgi:hypothetical protein
MHDSDRDYERGVADDRTRRVPRVTDEGVRDDERPVVNVNQSASDVPHAHIHHEPASVLFARKAQQAVWYFFGILETLLALRFILLAVGANPANPFFSFILSLTSPLVAPFANLVQTPQIGASILELGTVFAMIIYLLLAVALAKLVELLLTRGNTY